MLHEMHFLALLVEFHKTFSVDAFLDKDGRVDVWVQKVKGQSHSMTDSPAGGGISLQSPTLCVLISSLTKFLIAIQINPSVKH